jgi:hypothetical protein
MIWPLISSIARAGLQALDRVGELALEARRHRADQLARAAQRLVEVLRGMVRRHRESDTNRRACPEYFHAASGDCAWS